jgi:hypothetical protein
LGLEYILLARGFVREVLDACEAWKDKDAMPLKMQELMMVLQIEADTQRHKNTFPATHNKSSGIP